MINPGAVINTGRNGSDDEEMSAAERELAEDAQWKRIQQNTFTRWANEHLKQAQKDIADLETDLGDGLRLISLIEVLSGKRLPKHNRRPTFRSQRLENVSVALQFLEKDENIRIVNIDSTDIVDCKLKLILGLIWTLILHYSITLPIFDGQEQLPPGEKNLTPKQRLLHWIKKKIPDIPIGNFTGDWNDGRAVGALVDSVAPGICPDWPDWVPIDASDNASEAMTLADNWLGIPQLITPEELVNPNCDELSMMTYLSQYPHAKLKEGAPVRQRTNFAKVRCYGPGVESSGLLVGAQTQFTVETFNAGKGKIEAFLQSPNGSIQQLDSKFNNDRNLTYTCFFTPKSEGDHLVTVKFSGREIIKSPFNVKVEGFAGDSTKVTAFGPGLAPTGVKINNPAYFEIITADAGKGTPEVVILDPAGRKNSIPVKIRQISEGLHRCEYVTPSVGLHSVNIFFVSQQIIGSPFGVRVSPANDPKKVKATGRGLQPVGVRVGDAADFKVFTEGAGEGKMDIKIIGPGGITESCKSTITQEFVTEYVYHPKKEGRYTVIIHFDEQEVPKSPFEVNVGPFKDTQIKAYGPGLRGGVVGYPSLFTVETSEKAGSLGFSIEGPSQAKIDCYDNGDGSADVSYYPTIKGEYVIHILCNNEEIPGSPHIAQILPRTDYFPNKVKCHGPGLQRDGLITGKEVQFTVNTKEAGDAPLSVEIMNSKCGPIDFNVADNQDGIYNISYSPRTSDKHTIHVAYGGVSVQDSPFRVYANENTVPSAVKVFGPGVEPGVKCDNPTNFEIDCRNAGPGDVQIALTDDFGHDVPLNIQDNNDGTFTALYKAPIPGNYKITVLYGEVEVPQSPISVQVLPTIDVTRVKVDGLEQSVFVDSATEFEVDTRALSNTAGEMLCIINNPSGVKTDSLMQNLGDGTYRISYTPFETGCHTIDLFYNGVPVPGSPYTVNVRQGCDPSRCRAYGPGLQKGFVSTANSFTVETKGAGTGGLGLAIEGPSEAKMTCQDNRDGSCTVEYTPFQPGEYDVSIKFGDEHIYGSPFKVNVETIVESSSVNAWGPGLEPSQIREGKLMQFHVDGSNAGEALLGVDIRTQKGPIDQPPEIRDKDNGNYDVSYIAAKENSLQEIKVTWGNEDVPGSPFRAKVRPTFEAEKVKISGPALSNKGIPASVPTDLLIDTIDAGDAELNVKITGPDGYPRKVKVNNNKDGTYAASYIPDDCGKYQINVTYGGDLVPFSPLPVQAYATGKADRCKITEGNAKELTIGEEYCISVNTENAGYGAITCKIRSSSGSDLEIDIEENSDGTFSIYYTVKDAGDYTLSVKFGGQPVPEGFYSFTAYTQDEFQHQKKVNGYNNYSSHPEDSSYRPVELHNIPLPTTGGQVTAEVKMPSGTKDKPLIEDNRDGTVSIRYEPTEEGMHELIVKYNGGHVQGSPFKFHVDSISSGYVTAYGVGLVHGITGEPCSFTISTKDAGSGGLALAVEGPSKAEISCHDNKDGTVSVSFLPTAPGEYKIAVKFDEKHIKGSPYSVKITGEGRKRNQISVGSQSEVSFPGKVKETEIKSLNACIKAPSGLEEPCFLKKLPDGHLGISFTPREMGEHLVSVKRMGNHITSSPFKINVAEKEVGDASKVVVSGNGLKGGITQIENNFKIDTRKAGYGGLSLSIEGPSKADIQCKDNEDGTLTIGYKPTEPGYYIINLKFADNHVNGSPYTSHITGEGSNQQRERIQRQREAVPVTEVGSQCRLTFKMPSVSTFDLSASVMSPAGTTEAAEIGEVEDGLYGVNFIPKELGVHTVSVKYTEMHIPGSPFQFTVGPLKDGGAHRVHVGGPGLERGEQNETNEFNVWTREAGAGTLAISVEGPSKAEIDFIDRKDGSCHVAYKVTESGEYRVGIKFNEKHVPDSPFRVYVTPAMGDARKIEISQFPDQGSLPNKACNFLVLRNGAPYKGQIDCKVISHSGKVDDCFMDRFDDDIHSVRFVPRENGVHNIHIKYDGIHIPGSPFRLRIGKDEGDPAAVAVTGAGIEAAVSGHKMDFIVDTCNAGAGTLAVTIDGPSKVSMDCTEVEEGYKVRYTPLTPGDYYIAVKYNGYHIVGSPYKVRCSGEAIAEKGTVQESSSVVVETVEKSAHSKHPAGPVLPHFTSDASKVTSKGLGLKKAHMNRQNNFTVNAAAAGNNILYVGVYGPKAPCEEVSIKHTGNYNYQVNYMVRDRGNYLIFVRWGDDHVPGSPFSVTV